MRQKVCAGPPFSTSANLLPGAENGGAPREQPATKGGLLVFDGIRHFALNSCSPAAFSALSMSSDVERSIMRIVDLCIALSGAGLFSPTNIKDVIASLYAHRKWTLCDEISLPWLPSSGKVEIVPRTSPSGAVSAPTSRTTPPARGVPPQSRYNTRATGAGAARSILAPSASRRAVAGGASSRDPATTTAAAATTEAAVSRAGSARGGSARMTMSTFAAVDGVPARKGAQIERSLVRAAPLRPGASSTGRLALFSTLPATPRVLKESADLQP